MSTLPLLVSSDPVTGLRQLCEQYPEQVVFTTSLGLEDQALTDLIARNNLPVQLVTLDTGRLFPETYDLIDRTRSKYPGTPLQSFFPDTTTLEEFVNQQGMSAIFQSLEARKECCHIRKIAPLKRALDGAAVWVTGLRAAQSDNRATLPRIEHDTMTGLVKYNPLVDWSDAQLETYIHSHGVPTNPLHRKGFPSIGCAPCTRAVLEGEHPRAGRWWWEHSSKECGLHKG
ncbi:MAG: phosphoadenylyl-sulfate reductase [Bacteroidetes bacterium]|nr:phosphoadenylyl-sulfate reductase [Bacteroidota bacterium]MDA0904520.1 phosphoadenylyl-sulfate reductase [Bacteroidota bacterium]MDA1242264.1 phosphoadenylyl-sulfate reductase [Bacteroidota bacterium]